MRNRKHLCYQKVPPLGYIAENTPAIKNHCHSDSREHRPEPVTRGKPITLNVDRKDILQNSKHTWSVGQWSVGSPDLAFVVTLDDVAYSV